jgi:RNA polymerase sigma-70 factor (ECF subfamily)
VALGALYRAYRAPVLAYIRHRGYALDQAEDLTQAFFARLLEHGGPSDGGGWACRRFLLTAVKRFLINAEQEGRTIKRGGAVRFESIDAGGARLAAIPSEGDDPERALERAWAMAVLTAALEQLRAETLGAGKGELFEQLRDFLLESPDRADYARMAGARRLRRNTLAVAVHRLRLRLRELIRAELATCAPDGDDVEREMQELRAALAPLPDAAGEPARPR